MRETGPRINDRIRGPEIRLIGAEGENIGVVTPGRAMQLAEEAGLDLVEISPNAVPPVCKIMDFGKFKYETQKKEAEARKKQKIIEIKEGREMAHQDLGRVLLDRVAEDVKELGKVESMPRVEGRQMVMMIGPAK